MDIRLLYRIACDAQDAPHQRVHKVIVLLRAKAQQLRDQLLASMARKLDRAVLDVAPAPFPAPRPRAASRNSASSLSL
jgi:hypothetical protein